ncbi:signal peptidase I [Buchnera aphidicola str. Bp (Baizongia pistaciae)]|uniref:Signal peptidase I n=1 Tax=Buchnera aphidicola subsp. Baizongia pistaciae (strain Bp) TaxID=224915 RepID=LEP_BUCBP|nr:signal peptidase I [Buchnera aphidicola]Q89AM6.1 RecName: Full=Signal peptidase I; Short=SPase I; AltName: Full=Leader peptidase I [Buchnera aphidicola str. Bp (Baizongia pistaciae)]AAO26967.1 signal peptidase I [Buchnera aphidicola str. Bp (Baizongia pistaciae)]
MSNYLSSFLLASSLITGTLWIINKILSHNLLDSKIPFNIKKSKIYYKSKQVVQTFASFFPILIIVFIIRTFICEPFQIPSESMMPTLLPGDFILVKKFSYGIKNPFSNNVIVFINTPKRGDIVVFKHPNNNAINYVKRIVGLPGDKINYNILTKRLTITPNNINEQHTKNISINYKYIKPNDFTKHFKLNNIILNNVHSLESSNNNLLQLEMYQEKIEKIAYNIFFKKKLIDQKDLYFKQFSQKQGTWIVPKHKYFVLGDNRDNSLDSRYWGFVPEKNLIGKVVFIWMHLIKKEGQWPTGIQFDRIGNIY